MDKNTIEQRVEAALDKVRPALEADGGNVELVQVNGDVVTVKLKGACGSCPMATYTLQMGVERVIKHDVPEVKEVVAV